MLSKILVIVILSSWLPSCANFDNHQLKVEKSSESLNGVRLSISLVGSAQIHCKGIVTYDDIILQHFELSSYNYENPFELTVNYPTSSKIAYQLATDFVLGRDTQLEIFIQNKENDFYRSQYILLTPKIPLILTGIELSGNEITKRYPIGLKQEVYDIDSYLLHKNISLDYYTLERIATVSLLLKNGSRILPTVIPAGEDIRIYKDKNNLEVSVTYDSTSFNPLLLLYPSVSNKYYEGLNLYEITDAHYRGDGDVSNGIKLKNGKYSLKQNFDIEELIGEYDLYLAISGGVEEYFFYKLGSVIFDKVAPEFNEWVLGDYYFGGNELYEGKVYLDYSIPFKRNPYDVVFSGKVFGDVKDISIDGELINFRKNSDLVFTKKIYIYDGYKEVDIKISDAVGNLKSYTIPLIVSNN